MAKDKNKRVVKTYYNFRRAADGSNLDLTMTSTRGKMFSDCSLSLEKSTGEKFLLDAGEVQNIRHFIEDIINDHWPDNIYDCERRDKLPRYGKQ